ncbi:MAG: hypothetical protein ACRC8D_07230 [Aeromonas sp.]
MLDSINATELANTLQGQIELTEGLAALLEDLRAGKGYVIMAGSCPVTVAIKGQSVVVAPCSHILAATRYSRNEAEQRVKRIPADPDQYQAVPYSVALAERLGRLQRAHASVCSKITQMVQKL